MGEILTLIPFLLLGVGFFYIFKLKGFYLLHPVKTLRRLRLCAHTDGTSPWRALALALAGTLGVGNIVGVATALYLGGPGAIFWMIFSALIAMVLKYAEICLAMGHRRVSPDGVFSGGAPDYIKDGFSRRGYPRLGRGLGSLFALLCLLNTFTMGSMLQANAVAGAMEAGFSVSPWVTGGIVALLSWMVTLGGARRISAVTEKLVPAMTIIFLLMCLSVLILRYDRILPAVYEIFKSALSPSGIGGGVLGFATSKGFQYGIMRGLVSNEAGCGTAPMAHVTAEGNSPSTQGIFGLIEVFVDTILLCGITALAIMVSDIDIQSLGNNGVLIARTAFSSVLGSWAGILFSLSVLCFGVATILCWSHYGTTSLGALLKDTGRHKRTLTLMFALAFAISVWIGALSSPEGVWQWADMALGIMTLLNLLALLVMHKEVVAETRSLWS